MAILDDVKLALRINHTALDSELTANIAEARAEMVRNGIDESIANDDNNPLIVAAIKTYCKFINTDIDKTAERYEESWKYQLDCLRKSTLPEPTPTPEPDPEPEPEPEPEPTPDPEPGEGGDGE